MLFPKWSTKQASSWESVRARGKARFVFLRGGLGIGTAMMLSCLLGPFLFHHVSPTWNWLCSIVVLSPLAGILWGILMWNMLEGAYRSFLSEKELRELSGGPDNSLSGRA